MRPPLYAHQEETVEFLMQRKNAAVLSEQGTGKTRSVIEFVNRKFPFRDFRVLVVCPATLINVWKEEIMKFADHHDHFVLRGGTMHKRLESVKRFKPGWYLINYEGLRAVRKKSNVLAGGKDWSVVVADEMTRIKNPTAKQSKAMHDFSRPGGNFDPIRIGLTGTPITQSPLDAFSQFKFVEPRLFGDKFFAFRNRYAVMEKKHFSGRSFSVVSGYQHLDEITKKMFEVSIRHTKKQCLDLPDKIYQRVKVDWSPSSRKLYKELGRDLISELEDGSVVVVGNALAKLAKLRQVCGGFVYERNSESPDPKAKEITPKPEKISTMLGIVEDTPGQLIVWACFKKDLDNICKALDDAGVSFGRITGNEDTAERAESVRALQANEIKVVVAQAGVAQYGLTMTAAETAIFYSQGFSAEDRMQAEDRNHRIGTKNAVRYIDLVMRDSVDESISEVLGKKKSMAQKMTRAELEKVVYCSGV
jgi:SNF2 family DNA or RNA helicase